MPGNGLTLAVLIARQPNHFGILAEELKLDIKKTKRIVFHEITKSAILKAIENPREIDYNLVNAQQARRVLDRLVGYELSPVLWRKIKGGLSAGRVQSVSVRLIVEREREIQNFNAVASYSIVAEFVIALKTIRLVFFASSFNSSTRCHAIASQIGRAHV